MTKNQSMYPRWCFQRHFDGDPFLPLATLANVLVLAPFHYRSLLPFRREVALLLSFVDSFPIQPVTLPLAGRYTPCNYESALTHGRTATRKKARASSVETVSPCFSSSPSREGRFCLSHSKRSPSSASTWSL